VFKSSITKATSKYEFEEITEDDLYLPKRRLGERNQNCCTGLFKKILSKLPFTHLLEGQETFGGQTGGSKKHYSSTNLFTVVLVLMTLAALGGVVYYRINDVGVSIQS